MVKRNTLAVLLSCLANFAYAGCDGMSQPFKYGVNAAADIYAIKGNNSLDVNGVLVVDYGTSYNGLGKWQNPFFISRYANALYRDWFESGCQNNELLNKFLIQADYLASAVEYIDERALWLYPFENSHYSVEAGWFSGIGQSHIANVLYRAYSLTDNFDYKKLANDAMLVYLEDVSSGGVMSKDVDGNLWIQEVPDQNSIGYNILNGHITGLLGVLDYKELSGSESFDRVIALSIDSVANTISSFDAGFSSFYSLNEPETDQYRVAPIHGYNSLHAYQLNILYDLTGNEIFKIYANLFSSYDRKNFSRTAYGSTNSLTHGPMEAGGFYGTRFWSHNVFPTWYEVDLERPTPLLGIYIGSYIQRAAPSKFEILVDYGNGSYKEIYAEDENLDRTFFLSFENPAVIERFRIVVYGDNGNNNVAFNSIQPIICRPWRDQDCSSVSESINISKTYLQPSFFSIR